MATTVIARFSSSMGPVPDPDPDPPFTFLSDLLVVAPPPEPPDPPGPRTRPGYNGSVLKSSGVKLSTALCSSQSSAILGENPWLPFTGPFTPCTKRSGLGSSVYWSKSHILEPCFLLGFDFLNSSLLLLWNEDVVLYLKLFLPQFEDVAVSGYSFGEDDALHSFQTS
ncbi:Uncharacterized protein Rs2_09788 [Raphanus sativus]|nr:Uncharacterized protein Rs2_52164 [Raphanus sativus]KAJ4906130.1 Uncharacterized protein Rs2_09788 [Raphanus sativus]